MVAICLQAYTCLEFFIHGVPVMQKLKTTIAEPASRIEKGIVVGWAVLVFVVIMVAAGLAQNFAALRSIVTEGILRGHLSCMHYRYF